MGAKESGASFIAGVLAKLPESLRAQAEQIFKTPEAEAAVTLVGDGVLARSDYSKQMDALTNKQKELDDRQAELNDWFGQNEGALKEYLVIKPEYDKLKGNPPANPPNPPANPPPTGLTEKQVAEMMESRDRGFAAAMALVVPLSQTHFQMFGEVLNMQELMADPKLGRPIDGQPGRVYGLQDAYDSKHGTRVAEKREAARNAEIEKEVQKRLQEERAKLPPQLPYPVRDASPSPLDALTAERKPAEHTVDSAVDHYNRLQEQRATSAA